MPVQVYADVSFVVSIVLVPSRVETSLQRTPLMDNFIFRSLSIKSLGDAVEIWHFSFLARAEVFNLLRQDRFSPFLCRSAHLRLQESIRSTFVSTIGSHDRVAPRLPPSLSVRPLVTYSRPIHVEDVSHVSCFSVALTCPAAAKHKRQLEEHQIFRLLEANMFGAFHQNRRRTTCHTCNPMLATQRAHE